MNSMPDRPTFTLAIKPAGVDRFKRRAKVETDADFARVLDIDHAQVSRVLAGKAAPGPRFIAGAVAAFGWHALKDLFDIVPVSDRSAA